MKLSINKSFLLNICILMLIFVAPLSVALTNIFVGLVILLWIVEGNFKEKFNKLKNLNKALVFFLLIYVLQFVSLLWSDSIYTGGYWSGYYNNAIDFLLRHEFFYLIVALIVYTSFKKEWTQKAINVFIAVMLISEIVSYGIIFGLWTTKKGHIGDPSPFLNHSAYSALLAWTIFLLLEKFFRVKNIYYKSFYGFFITTATLNLFLNTGRTGQLVFIVLLIFYIIEKFKLSWKSILFSFLGVSLMIGLNYKFNKTFNNRVNQAINDIKLINQQNYASSWGLRYLSILLSKKCLDTNPFFGYGFGDAKKEVMLEVEKYDEKSAQAYKRKLNPHMHNQYLQFFNEIGLVGIFLLLAFFYFYFKTNFSDEIKIIAHLFMIDYVIIFFTGTFLRRESTFILFLIFTTIFLLNKKEKS